MNTSNLAKQLRELSNARLDVLAQADLQRFSTQLDKLAEKIARTEKLESLTALEAEVPFAVRDFFGVYIKKAGLKKPRKTAPLPEFDSYAKEYRALSQDFKKRTRELGKLLERLRKSSDENALSELEKMQTAELDEISRLAKLMKKGANRSTLFKVPKSKNGRLDWLSLLRKSDFDNWF